MKQNGFSVILVPSTSHAMRAEKILQEAEIKCKLIPVPRQLSSNCGICIRVLQSDKDEALYVLENAKLEIGGCHDL